MMLQTNHPPQQSGNKTIVVLTGSNNDINKDGKPTSLVENLQNAVKNWNQSNSSSLKVVLRSCSADRTPFLLPSVLNEERADGILYAGGYALVLGAALQSALLYLSHSKTIKNYEDELRAFIESEEKEYLPGLFRPDLVQEEESKYLAQHYIPTIGIPCKDTPSQGTSAFQSIAENPSGCEPRMAVGLQRMDTALWTMGQMLQKRERVILAFQDDRSGAEAIGERLRSFGWTNFDILPSEKVEDLSALIFYVGDPFHKALKALDERIPLVVLCPLKQSFARKWEDYLAVLSNLDHTLCLGVGNYGNAAILAVRLAGDGPANQRMWKYRNEKTFKGVLYQPPWLSQINFV